MESVKTLLDRGLETCKTKRKLAAHLQLTEQNLQGIYSGRRFLSTEQALLLADLIGADPCQVLAQAHVEREADPEKRALLREGFFRRAMHGGVAACLLIATLYGGDANARRLSNVDYLYIVRSIRAALRLAAAWLSAGRASAAAST